MNSGSEPIEVPGALGNDYGLPAKYLIRGVLGQGGMGIVLHVCEKQLERDLAIKLLNFEGSTETLAQERFLREAKTLAKLNHPNIVKLLSFDISGNGHPYMVMEYLEGRTFSSCMESGLEPALFLEFFADISSGLSHAHSLGIVHRDLKPGNIMICQSDAGLCPKLIDFGIALSEDSGASGRLTRSSSLLGTPAYMSPEQCRGDKVDHRSDLYSLACIMYEALLGRRPFQGSTALEALHMVANAEFVHLEKLAASNEALRVARLVDACLSRNPDDRPASAELIFNELSAIRTSQPDLSNFKFAAVDQKLKTKRLAILALASAGIITAVVAGLYTVMKQQKQLKTTAIQTYKLVKKTNEESNSQKIAAFKRTILKLEKDYEQSTDPERKRGLAIEVTKKIKKLSDALVVVKQINEAEKYLQKVPKYYGDIEVPELTEKDILWRLARIEIDRGNFRLAKSFLEKSWNLVEKTDSRDVIEACDTLCTSAILNIRTQNIGAALEDFRKAKKILMHEKLGDEFYEVKMHAKTRNQDFRVAQCRDLLGELKEQRQLNVAEKVKGLEFRCELLEFFIFRKSDMVDIAAGEIEQFQKEIPPGAPGLLSAKAKIKALLQEK